MSQPTTQQQEEIKSAYKEIYAQVYEKTIALFKMYDQGIKGLENKILNPLYTSNQTEDKKYLYDFPSFYQIEGVQFLLDQKRVLIADEMGVGKTAQAIGGKIALENQLGRKVKTLIICPSKQVKSIWVERLKEYITKERYKEIKIENIVNFRDAKIQDADLVLIDYHALSFSDKKENNCARKELKKKLLEAGFEYLILDEAHNVKNYDSASRFSHVNELAKKVEYLCLLSGTATPTSFEDGYALVALLKPEHIDENGNKVGYKDAKAVAAAHSRTLSVVGAVLRTSRLERTLESVAKLPPKTDEYTHIDIMSPEQREIYDSIYEDDSLTGLQKIQKLKQALLNPTLIDPSFNNIPKAKYEALDDIVNALPENEKIVIYSPNFTKGVVKFLKDRYENLGSLYMEGSNKNEREAIIKQFQDDLKKRVMVMSDVGSEGISLTSARTLVLLEEPYSPGERKQVVARLYRPGQKNSVRVLTLNVRDTIDDGMREFLVKKKEALNYFEKGVDLTPEQKILTSGDNPKALARWLQISKNYLYTPSQITSLLINNTREKPEDKVVKKLEGEFGKRLADSLSKSWDESILGNCAQIYSHIVTGIEKKEGRFEKMVDIASGFGGLSHALQRKGIYNVDADKHHFNSPYASQENINLVGKMTHLPLPEKTSFDFALCSMGLDILPNTLTEPGRVKAVAEANRVLKKGGYYMITFPGPLIPENDKRLREGIEKLGFESIPELTGFIKSKDKKINSHVYVLTARKTKDISKSIDLAQLTTNFELDTLKVAKKKGNSQRRRGKAIEFEFIRSQSKNEDEKEKEDLQDAINRFLKGKKALK